jgi:DNA-binding transcriptional LysR family regulator
MRQLKVTMDAQVAVLAVAERGSLESAGKYLGIGKSAIRKRIQSIESELGTTLFSMVGKRIMLTEAGNLYMLAARESVRQAWLGVDRVQALLRAQTSNLRIGYSTYLNTKLLDVVRHIRPAGIVCSSLTKESLMTHQIVAGVLQGDLHVGFGSLPLLEPDLSTRLLFEEPLMVCLPAGHPLTTKSTIQPEELADEPMVSVMRRALPGSHEEIAMHFESLGIALKFSYEAFSVSEALWLVTQNVGVALMTRFSAMSHRYDVIVRPLSDRLLTVKSGVFARRDHSQQLIRDFMDIAWTETAALRTSTLK